MRRFIKHFSRGFQTYFLRRPQGWVSRLRWGRFRAAFRAMVADWAELNERIVNCERCGDLRAYCAEVARVKRRAYRDDVYWGRPVPNLGPQEASLLLVGLAPGAHGANRTGRLFTGDASGDFLFAAMHACGLANQPEGRRADDGLELIDCAISCAAHCAPPQNKPEKRHLAACAEWLEQTIRLMPRLRAICCLGAMGFDAVVRTGAALGWQTPRPRPRFAHGASFGYPCASGGPTLFCCYHPSQQNVNTGVLTQDMMREVLSAARDTAQMMERNRGGDVSVG